ncbi:hypothetical protein CLAFUW4_06812 [Fulvia fulva]|nr:hypothetical protein CLAFUR4_06820 [Fulvia fulva]WPV15935.1 hypothetical protein CLAFUW4_06812 [Fulvia fulva]WPV30853.1 hypothetical protein CLAFUW7_06811 [Fulvia fulva]
MEAEEAVPPPPAAIPPPPASDRTDIPPFDPPIRYPDGWDAPRGFYRYPQPPVPAIDEHHSDSNEDHEGESDHEDEESDEDDEVPPHMRWHEIHEDTSEPSPDEQQWIADHADRYPSALDHEHWAQQAFLDLKDPEFETIDTGRIEWHVEAFNGTKEKPNTEKIMRSQIVRIAGLDWQIKFYPRGNRDSDNLCVYIDCVSMRAPEWEDLEELDNPPFPVLEGADKIKVRRSVAAQIAVVMYNPAEPRANEFKIEAHNYHKKNPDFGWPYFTHQRELQVRRQSWPQAILRNDKLSFTAYIRVVRDPTRCLWEHDDRSPGSSTSLIGLRPFTRSFPYIAATIPLLHYGPFRKLVQQLSSNTSLSRWLQTVLLKMYSRSQKLPCESRGRSRSQDDKDVAEVLWKIARTMNEQHPGHYDAFTQLIGSCDPQGGAAIGPGRLNTKDYPSIQAAINKHHEATPLAQPELLILELQRQEHDKKERKWKKIANSVDVEERVTVGGVSYQLYAFVTHQGPLHSPRYSTYLRPDGTQGGWYAYQKDKVFKVTEKQAKDKRSGPITTGHDSPHSGYQDATAEVTQLVIYVQDEAVPKLMAPTHVETWAKPLETTPDANTDSLEVRLQKATSFSTPEPGLTDGEDVIMKDADQDSEYGSDDNDPAAIGGIVDWLGRPYYEGQWQGKKYHGGGNLIDLNGDEYLGSFNHGLKHGFGQMTYSTSGNVYNGEWEDDLPHGQGTLTEKSSGNIYTGGFKHGKKHGKFTLTGTVTEEDQSCCSICYEEEIDIAFDRCGHAIACHECASQIDVCPICRKAIQSRIRLVGVKVLSS